VLETLPSTQKDIALRVKMLLAYFPADYAVNDLTANDLSKYTRGVIAPKRCSGDTHEDPAPEILLIEQKA
jgi:hypothetical protein